MISFNTFSGAAPFNTTFAFFGVADQNGKFVLLDQLLPNAGQHTISANELKPGQAYSYTLIFSNNLVGTDTKIQLNSRTQGFFTTAAPEPSSFLLAGMRVLAIVGWQRRRRP